MAYEFNPGLPWLRVVLAECDSNGNYAVDGRYSARINVVQLICSDSNDPDWYLALANRIATFLGWHLQTGKLNVD